MNSMFKRLLNVKGRVVEDVRIVDEPMRPQPVLEVRFTRARACSDAPAAADVGAATTAAMGASLASSGFRLLAGGAGKPVHA